MKGVFGVFGLALNLSKLTTRKGAKIEVHFEDISGKTLLEQQYSHSEFLKKVNDDIDQWGYDNGHDTVHLLINDQGAAALITEAKYTKWQDAPEKDWFHEEMQVIVLGGFLEDVLMDELLLLLINTPPENNSEFVGMSEEEFDEFFADPNNFENLKAVQKAYPECCRFCPKPNCRGRESNFNRLAYEQAITALQITTIKE
jgi:hypothetical protein